MLISDLLTLYAYRDFATCKMCICCNALNGPQLEEQLPYNLPWRSNGVIIHPSDNAASPNDVTEIATCCNGIYIVNIEDDNSLHESHQVAA